MRREKRVPSNRMPAYEPEQVGVIGWLIVAFLLGVAICVFIRYPIICLVLGGLVGILILSVLGRSERRRMERRGESICTFARGFDCRRVDTWILRAVHEEVGRCAGYPIRPGDPLEDLGFDSEELEDVVEVIAQRSGRSMDGCEQNPFFGRVDCVGDIVEFFVEQPRTLGLRAE